MTISIKKLDGKGNVSRYLVKGTSPTLINTVRRSVMLHTPCLAIEDVSIYQNGSVMFDEMLAHRLGMLPIKTDKTYKPGDKVELVVPRYGGKSDRTVAVKPPPFSAGVGIVGSNAIADHRRDENCLAHYDRFV